MLKRILLIFCLIFSLINGLSAENSANREELLNLLKERSRLFDQYSNSLNRKSGFFGQRTKNDLRESQERLKEIVGQDNRIISSLNRILEYRNFEKVTRTYDASRDEERLRNLTQVNDTLLKQLAQLENETRLLKKPGAQKYFIQWLGWILFVLTILWFRSKRKNRSSLNQNEE